MESSRTRRSSTYRAPTCRASYASALASILAAAGRTGLERFQPSARSGGGACSLAFIAEHPERVLTLAIDEPATDFSAADHADPYWKLIDEARNLPPDRAMVEFM